MVIYERLLDKTLWLRFRENARLETDIPCNTAAELSLGRHVVLIAIALVWAWNGHAIEAANVFSLQ